MRARVLAAILLGSGLWTCPAWADFQVTGNGQITGETGAGTLVPQARLEVRMDPSDAYALKVSSQNGDGLLTIDRTGKVAVGLSNPQSRLDLHGSGNGNEIGLQLRVGNSTSSTSSSQIVFASGSTETFRHSIRTRHTASQNLGNAIDFYLWQSTGQANALGNVNVLSLQASTATYACSVHVRPAGDPVYELEVSSGSGITGGGIIRYASAGQPSVRTIKSDITYLDLSQEAKAYEELKSLRHAQFRYKGDATLRRGLIYEDAPASIQRKGKSLAVDARLLNLEMALKETQRQVLELEALISAIEKKRGGKK